jgi:hypothetical protein
MLARRQLMVRKLEPIIGEWYRDHGEQRLFEVVALDDDEDRINIQYADGDLLQLNNDSWRNLLLSMAPPPEAEQDSESDADNRTGDLPADDWHDSHDDFGLDDDY